MMAMFPPMTMKHNHDRVGKSRPLSRCTGQLIVDSQDITKDNLIYSTGQTTIVFKDDPAEEVIRIPVAGVFTRVPPGAAGGEAGKINSMTIYEDHTPTKDKMQSMMSAAGVGNGPQS